MTGARGEHRPGPVVPSIEGHTTEKARRRVINYQDIYHTGVRRHACLVQQRLSVRGEADGLQVAEGVHDEINGRALAQQIATARLRDDQGHGVEQHGRCPGQLAVNLEMLAALQRHAADFRGDDFQAMRERLQKAGMTFKERVVPGGRLSQLFVPDPDIKLRKSED